MSTATQDLALLVIGAWSPRGCKAEAAGFARDVVSRASPAGPPRARALLLACSSLAEWGLGLGITPGVGSLLNEAMIERHVSTGMGAASDSSRRTRRANLRFVAKALGVPLYPEPSPISRSGPAKPYKEAEIAAYLALARHQPLMRRRAMEAMISLGAGAGLDGTDMRYVTGNDVFVRAGGVVVAVRGGRERVVPVLRRYHEIVIECADYADDSYMVGGMSPARKNVTTPVLERARGGTELGRLSVARLRSTWLSEQIQSLGLHAFLRAAGLKSSQRLVDLAIALPGLGEGELVVLLGSSS